MGYKAPALRRNGITAVCGGSGGPFICKFNGLIDRFARFGMGLGVTENRSVGGSIPPLGTIRVF
jgi:hypothetical protein